MQRDRALHLLGLTWTQIQTRRRNGLYSSHPPLYKTRILLSAHGRLQKWGFSPTRAEVHQDPTPTARHQHSRPAITSRPHKRHAPLPRIPSLLFLSHCVISTPQLLCTRPYDLHWHGYLLSLPVNSNPTYTMHFNLKRDILPRHCVRVQ